MSRDQILDKIRKALRLADPSSGAGEAEVLAATAAAKRLMDAHNIKIGEVATEEDPVKVEVVVSEAYSRRGNLALKKYERWLGIAVAKLTTTSQFLRKSRSPGGSQMRAAMCFIGDEVDVAVAVELYNYLRNTMHRFARERLGVGFTPSHRNYCEGFTMRIYERANETIQHTAAESTALVLVETAKRDAILRMQDKIGVHDSKRNSSANGANDNIAKNMGYRDAGKVDLGTKNRLSQPRSAAMTKEGVGR